MPHRKKLQRAEGLGLIGWVVLCVAAGAIGALFPPGEWYAQLNKPSFNPPNWIFGPVWTLLYLMMAVAAWRFSIAAPPDKRTFPLGMFLFQLLLNVIWSPVFFGLHQLGTALGIIVVLWLAIAATMLLFLRHDRIAGLLLAPYLAWVSFATLLNAALWQLNR